MHVRKECVRLRSAYKLSESMYVETNLSSQHKIDILRELFDCFSIDYQDLKFSVRPKQKDLSGLDLSDENTYYNVTCGDLAYQMFTFLLENNKLSQADIDLLMTKEYTREHFKKVVYPVLALSRVANRGDSKTYRYYNSPVIVNGINIFISSQWFDESREDLITFFKNKLS